MGPRAGALVVLLKSGISLVAQSQQNTTRNWRKSHAKTSIQHIDSHLEEHANNRLRTRFAQTPTERSEQVILVWTTSQRQGRGLVE